MLEQEVAALFHLDTAKSRREFEVKSRSYLFLVHHLCRSFGVVELLPRAVGSALRRHHEEKRALRANQRFGFIALVFEIKIPRFTVIWVATS